jgi:N-acetylmuramoyl-L-alanine amidase
VPVAPDQTVEPGWQSPETPVDAALVGVTWQGDPSAEFTIESRGADGTWTAATPVEGDGEFDPGTKDAARAATVPAHGTEPVWIGEDATAVRVTLQGDAPATDVAVAAVDAPSAPVPDGAAGALGDTFGAVHGTSRWLFGAALLGVAALLAACALGWSPWRFRGRKWLVLLGLGALVLTACVPATKPPPPAKKSKSTSGAPGVVAPARKPSITSRSSWGAQPFDCGTPDYAPALKLAVVHHTVNSNNYSPSQAAQLVRSIQAYHMHTLGYCDIAYNFLIARDGTIFEGRAGGTSKPVIGAHAGGFNTASTGIALIGDYSGSQPPGAQWNALVDLLRWRLSAAGIDPSQGATATAASSPCGCVRFPNGQSVHFPNAIVGHRELDFTECPGNAFFSRMGELRGAVQAGISTAATAPPPT